MFRDYTLQKNALAVVVVLGWYLGSYSHAIGQVAQPQMADDIVIDMSDVVNSRHDEVEGNPVIAASYHELISIHQSIGASDDLMQSSQVWSARDKGWWHDMVSMPLMHYQSSHPVSLEDVLLATLYHSEQLKVFSEVPLIRETAITEADSNFDWYGFVDSRWTDTSEPIGSTLTAGAGIRRFEDHRWVNRAGIGRRNTTGGQFEVSQELGYQDNNSRFFVPDRQGTARLVMSFSQPLLRGRGKVYNTSLTVLAQIDKLAADDEFRRQLESHLLEVTRAYWALYLERAVLYQKVNAFRRGQVVVSKLRLRKNVDASRVQIASAEATLKQRQSELQRAQAAVKNAESRLRSLTHDPALMGVEIIPSDSPSIDFIPMAKEESVASAFQCRYEVQQVIKQIKASCVRMNMSKHELLPQLNLVTEAYLSGLEDDGAAFSAIGRQFDTGDPSYSIGLRYEVPIWNRAAKARMQRRRLEVRQFQSQYATTLENIRLEVETAVREVETSMKEIETKHHALEARTDQLNALTKRWERLPGEEVTASLALENLLAAQDKLAAAEFEYLQSQLTYSLSLMNLKKATGAILTTEQIDVGRGTICDLPTYVLDKMPPVEPEFENGMEVFGEATPTPRPALDWRTVPE